MESLTESGNSILAEAPGLALAVYGKLRLVAGSIRDNWHTPKRWDCIRAYYAQVSPLILEGHRIDPYASGLGDFMTPIERALWNEIRYHGLPFYPQYPVGRRFVDFGDPVKRIAIEADGAAFHNPIKDAARDEELKQEGWWVFHITGRDAIYKDRALQDVFQWYGIFPEDEDGET